MVENEEFLKKVLAETGKTNLMDYFTKYLKAKEQRELQEAVPKDVMIPPNLLKVEEQKRVSPPAMSAGHQTPVQSQPVNQVGLSDNVKALLGSITTHLQG